MSVKPFGDLSVSVRPVAVLRCEFEFDSERAPEFFIIVPGAHWHIIVFPALSSSRLWSGLPSTRGGSLSTFEAKFTLLGNGLDRRAGRLAHSLSLQV